MKFATTARRGSISIPARRQLLYTSSYSPGATSPREEDRRHVAQLLQGKGRLRRQRITSRGSAITIGSSSIIRRLKALIALARQADEGDIQLGLAQGGHQIRPYCLPSGAGSPRGGRAGKRCSSVKICGWKASELVMPSDRLPFIPRAMPLAFSSAASLMARIRRASS